jgi:RNA polymerase sigma factor for flagellar operon FliA
MWLLPLVARRIHERLPQHVPIEDLYSAGVLGLLDAFGRFDPSKNEIAEKLNIPLADYRQLLGELKGLEIDTLHSRHPDDLDEEELAYIPNRPEDDPLFRYLDAEMRERLIKAIDGLPERERLVLTLYYYEETTMKEIGLILGILEPRVSQIHVSAVRHLRARLSAYSTTEESRQEARNSSGLSHGR